MKRINFMTLFIGTILVYTTLHVSEEASGNFPRFMIENWGVPDIGYGRWLFHNIVLFLPVLLIGLLIFSINQDRYLPFGVGISIWGIINFLEHLFYTIKNLSFSPGFFSSIIFLLIGILVFSKLQHLKKMSLKFILLSVICSISYWIIPIILILALSKPISSIFH